MYKFLNVLLMSLVLLTHSSYSKPYQAASALKFSIIKSEFVLDSDNIYRADLAEQNGIYQGLHLQLKPEAKKIFNRLTSNNRKKTMNLVLGNKILTSTVIMSPLDGDMLIAGITREDAITILQVLNTELKTSEAQK